MKKIPVLILLIMSIFAVNSAQASGEAMFNSLGCSSCHGAGGHSTKPEYPVLAGKDSKYIVKQLEDFRTGVRKSPTMNAMAPMAIGYEEIIADYLAAQ